MVFECKAISCRYPAAFNSNLTDVQPVIISRRGMLHSSQQRLDDIVAGHVAHVKRASLLFAREAPPEP